MMKSFESVAAVTMDLDDTLWPVWPNIVAAEADMHAWLKRHAPRTAERFDTTALRAERNAVLQAHPEWAHDLGALRREGLRRALLASGDDGALAEPGFEVFYAARQRVTFFDDALPALQRIASRFPILALTNGNANIEQIGIKRYFQGTLSAQDFGFGKPDPRIFHEACRRLGQPTRHVLHVGDDGLLDIVGARDAGLAAAWIDRAEVSGIEGMADVPRFADLALLADALNC